MTLRESIKSWKPNFLQIIVLLTVMQLLVTLLTDGFALSFDEAMWHYIGRNWFRHGLVPYSGGVDNKAPMIFAVFGLSDTLFGVNYWFPRILGTICQSVGIWYFYKIAKHLAGERAGLFAVSFYGLSLMWHGTGGRYVSFTETYQMLFIITAIYKYITAQNKKDYLISGLLAGIALAFRLTAIWGIIAILVAMVRRSRMNALVFCGGIAASIVLLLVLGFAAGIYPGDIFTFGLSDNFGSGSTTDHDLTWKLQNFSDKFFYSELILFYPFVLGYFFIKKRIDLFSLWFILVFIGINIVGIYGTLHMRELLPALAMMSASSVNYLIEKYRIPARQFAFVIWIVFFPKLLEPFVVFKKLISNQPEKSTTQCSLPFDKPDEGTRKRLGWWIRDNTAESEKVFVAGFGAQVQAYSERISPTIYFNVTQTKIAKERFYKDLNSNKPAMILVPLFSEYTDFVGHDMRQFLDDIIKKDYYLDRCMYSYNIYRIKK